MESSANAGPGNGPPSPARSGRVPRRLVLLAAADGGPVEKVLAEYPGEEARKVHEELPRLAAQNPGRVVAAEWLGPLGWTRFLWCRK
jgi:hypothetical protein